MPALASLAEPPQVFARDEQVINDALLKFMTALTVPIPGVKYKWCSDRNPFDNFQFGATNMEARTNGYLAAIALSASETAAKPPSF